MNDYSDPRELENRLYWMMVWAYITVLPAGALFFITAPITASIALYVNLAWYIISFAVQTFSLFAIRASMRNNPDRFPFGTGKLENFSAFMDGVLCIPIGIYLVSDALVHLLTPVPVGYVLGMIPMIITGGRLAYFYYICTRMMGETDTPSPILQAYTLSFRIGLFSNIGVIIAFIIGWIIVHSGFPAIGNRTDPAIALVMALYMVFIGAHQVWNNFRSLMDLPLTESEQLQVMKILSSFYDKYDGIRTIYTRKSGKEKIVELELFFPAEKTLGEIQGLQKDMELALSSELSGLKFRIIPEIQSMHVNDVKK